MSFALYYCLAIILDLLVGDPRWFPHPIRGIGALCQWFERLARKTLGDGRGAGVLAFVGVLGVTVVMVFATCSFLHKYTPWLEIVMAVLLVYFGLACRDLRDHSMAVSTALEQHHDLAVARRALQQIVGRNTAKLDEADIARGAVESIAENLVDGVLAPLFWGIVASLWGLPSTISAIGLAATGVFFYKAINTMDSMYGYKNSRYLLFGRVAARVDDFATFVPARLSVPFLLLAALFLRLDVMNGLRICWRDRLEHPSPNGGHPESVVAGILGVQLGGAATYFGRTVVKPTIGEKTRVITRDDILVANRLLLLSSLLFLVVGLIIRELIMRSML
ncbi:MAG: cobalamin biosynthesis protein CobD [Deltaproteobacteria bacterium]|nr:MAG: cobalamin biosynthesis protein CobD [Deltaproteobacteria bacterium]